MKYLSIQLMYNQATEKDVLGNIVENLQPSTKEFIGRFTEWTADEVNIKGRDVTKSQRKMLTSASLDECRTARAVFVNNETYKIKDVKDLQCRWRMLYLEKWK